MTEQIDWTAIQTALAAPFEPSEVEWRPTAGKSGANQRVSLVAYISAAAVMDRLDQTVGVGNWSFDWHHSWWTRRSVWRRVRSWCTA